MIFNSISYIFFLFIAVTLYWILPAPSRRWLILGASLLFYGMWRIEFVPLIVFSALVDYYLSLRIHASSNPARRRWLLGVSLTTNLGLLAYFKYTYFILENISYLGRLFDYDPRADVGAIILPLGISFYTFLSISYTLDVYRRVFEPVKNFPLYLAYVMFWPHMIAGPILRAQELIPQLLATHRLSLNKIVSGLKLILWGLFLKVGLADQLAPWVDEAFAVEPSVLGGLDVWTMSYAFGLQIYFDFAGYSFIAIGSARLLGIVFPDNFDWPYLATSPREFWKRWHITLSSWIRDYLYLPLRGKHFSDRSAGGIDVRADDDQGLARPIAALFLTWFLMGLWHGASWNFALWGLWHAVLILGYRLWKKNVGHAPLWWTALLGWFVTQPLLMLSWILFRTTSATRSVETLARIFDVSSYQQLGFRENFYLLTFVFFVGMVALGLATRHRHRFASNVWLTYAAEIGATAVVIFVVLIFFRPLNQFIYFQF